LSDLGGAAQAPGFPRSLGEGGEILTPNVVGLSARQALAVFARLGLTAQLRGTGFVISQEPASGTAVLPGQYQTLHLSETAPPINRPARSREETSSNFSGP
jgi:beta-lactam-binding protein with PASTA domain